MKFLILLTYLFLFSFTKVSHAQIIINGRSEDDGSKTVTKEDSLYIHAFSNENVGKFIEHNTKNDIYFELINADELKQIASKSKFTLVIIQSSWCGACGLVLEKYLKTLDSLKSEGLTLVLINQDVHIKNLKKKIKMENYYILSYIIDSKRYGTSEIKKQEAFITEMAGTKKLEGYSPGSVPQAFFLDQSGKLIYFEYAHNLNKDFILRNIINK
jgi:hypothetical protein